MILIDEILVSQELIDRKFVCKLEACKGACCIEGDYGAPLEDSEIKAISQDLEKIKAYIPEPSIERIEKHGFYKETNNKKGFETSLMDDGACVFMGRNEIGISYCGIEKAHKDKNSKLKKPISCHLYPIRVSKNEHTGFEALNYDEWDICSAACDHGDELGIRVYEFAREALIRKYGEAFYEALDDAARHLTED